jgi:hypothetical protein
VWMFAALYSLMKMLDEIGGDSPIELAHLPHQVVQSLGGWVRKSGAWLIAVPFSPMKKLEVGGDCPIEWVHLPHPQVQALGGWVRKSGAWLIAVPFSPMKILGEVGGDCPIEWVHLPHP